ncbi:uncharacterized protein [Rutidosis leptorrhynchoides]|uniref:uncharacterized protein isoform X2 n=1 Tax=Rutidosis leptorrhynchoides TaxID=125765 RepID=UPI003A99527D
MKEIVEVKQRQLKLEQEFNTFKVGQQYGDTFDAYSQIPDPPFSHMNGNVNKTFLDLNVDLHNFNDNHQTDVANDEMCVEYLRSLSVVATGDFDVQDNSLFKSLQESLAKQSDDLKGLYRRSENNDEKAGEEGWTI